MESTGKRVVVIGGGMLGAAVADGLAVAGREVVLLEAAPSLGGLASAWTIETTDGDRLTWDRFYHVVLGQDRRVVDLLGRLGLGGALHFTTVRSELLAGGRVLPMSSVLDLLRLPVLDPVSRLRVGGTIGLGAVLPVSGGERTTSAAWVRRWSGRAATRDLWLPLLRAKLGEEAEHASARFIRSTFRRLLIARLRGGDGDRFGWVEGGYAAVLERLAISLSGHGVDVRTGTGASSVARASAESASTDGATAPRWVVTTRAGETIECDEVVVTTPGPVAQQLIPTEPASSRVHDALRRVPYLGCVCVSVVLRRQVTGGYLTYVTDETPYTAVVEMTNLVDTSQTGGRHLIYLPRYCAPTDPAFDAPADEVAERAVSDLLTRYPQLSRDDVLASRVATARHVMPVPVPGRGNDAPPVSTGLPGLYLASSAQVTDGTLNIETTLALAEEALREILGPQAAASAALAASTVTATSHEGSGTVSNAAPSNAVSSNAASPAGTPSGSTASGSTSSGNAASTTTTSANSALAARGSQARAALLAVRDRLPSGSARASGGSGGGSRRLTASISLDADNLWSYMKTHGNPDWVKRPSYLSALGPRLIDSYARHGLTATVFVVGHDAATSEGQEFVSSLREAGHEIGNHSFEHEPWLHLYSRQKLDDELARTEDAITSAGAPKPIGFRGPGYSLSPTLLELLEQRGYRYDATTLPTWIGPLARAYYFRSAKLSAEDRKQRQALFGSAKEGLRPVGPYRWQAHTPGGAGLVELPVTTMPGAKIPIHVSYVLYIHQVNPALARSYVAGALRMCRMTGIGPSILLHPLDILDEKDAAELAFFPGMALPASQKAVVLDHVLTQLTEHFDVVGTGEHARRLATTRLRAKDPATAGIAGPESSYNAESAEDAQ